MTEKIKYIPGKSTIVISDQYCPEHGFCEQNWLGFGTCVHCGKRMQKVSKWCIVILEED